MRPDHIDANHFLYAMPLKHKHVPELQVHGHLDRKPIFSPSVGRFAQGMIVQVPLFTDGPRWQSINGGYPCSAQRPL